MGEARSDGGGLTTRKVRALVALLDSPSVAAAARKANVGERSIRRWIKEDASFRLKLRELRTELLTGTANKLQHDACSPSRSVIRSGRSLSNASRISSAAKFPASSAGSP